MSGSNAERVASGIWVSAGFGLSRGLQLLIQVVLARLLVPADFGLWAMVLVLTTFAGLFRELAIAQVLVHRGLEDRRLVDAVYSLGVNVSIGLGFLQALAGLPLALFFDAPVWPLAAVSGLVFFLGAGAGCHDAVLQRRMQFRELAIGDVIGAVGRLVGACGAAVLGAGVWSFVCGELAAAAVDAVAKRALSGYRFTYHVLPDREAVREVRGFVAGILGVNLAVQANTTSGNLVIGRLVGANALGYYSVAYQLAMLPVSVLHQLNRVNFSVLARLDKSAAQVYVGDALGLCAILSAPVYAAAWLAAPWAIPLAYGSDWSEAVGPFQALLVFAYARGFMSILGTALNAVGKPGINARINWALVPATLPACWLGAVLGGALGVAVAVAVVMGLAATLWFWLAVSRSEHWDLGRLVEPVVLPTLAALLAVVIGALLPVPVLRPVAALLVYAGAVSLFSAGRAPRLLLDLLRALPGRATA